MRLEELACEVRGCNRCRLCQTRLNAVPGEGKIDADILFIGEAPGRREDEIGKPFVGAAGRLLEEALSNAGIKRDEVYITNIVKCRPPNNRVPLQDEIDSCIEYLEREIRMVNPLVICILGSTSYKRLLKGTSITSDRGNLLMRNGRYYFVTIHPAAAIYNPSLRTSLMNDIEKLGRIVRELKTRGLEGYI